MSDHKHLSVKHRGRRINISYWLNDGNDKKIVYWEVDNGDYNFIREPIGGKSGLFGFGARPEKSFHEMCAEAIEKGVQEINEEEAKPTPPEPDNVVETLEIRGYEASAGR